MPCSNWCVLVEYVAESYTRGVGLGDALVMRLFNIRREVVPSPDTWLYAVKE